MIPLKFNLKQLLDLNEDFRASSKAIPTIVRATMRSKLREARRELTPLAPRQTGALVRSLGYSIKKKGGQISGKLGFMRGKRVSKGTAIAANVLQKPGATAKQGFLWIPLPGTTITAQQFFSSENTFIRNSKGGTKIAFQRRGDEHIPLFVLKRRVKLSRPPIPIEQKGIQAAEEITAEIPDVIAQVIAAKKAALKL